MLHEPSTSVQHEGEKKNAARANANLKRHDRPPDWSTWRRSGCLNSGGPSSPRVWHHHAARLNCGGVLLFLVSGGGGRGHCFVWADCFQRPVSLGVTQASSQNFTGMWRRSRSVHTLRGFSACNGRTRVSMNNTCVSVCTALQRWTFHRWLFYNQRERQVWSRTSKKPQQKTKNRGLSLQLLLVLGNMTPLHRWKT